MFTLIRNYRTMFMMLIASNFEGGKLTPGVDADKDGDLDMKDINKFSPETQAAIRRVLGQTNMKILEEGKRFSIESLIKNGFVVERNETISDTNSKQKQHKEEVGQPLAVTDFLANGGNAPENGTMPFVKETFVRTLARGSRGPDVTTLQVFLTNAGYDTKGVDGGFGGGTEGALIKYQKANGLTVSGKLGANGKMSSETLNHMLMAVNPNLVKEGSKNSNFRSSSFQNESISGSVESSGVAITYPTKNRDEALALQALIGANPDGDFGPNSRIKLQKFLQAKGFYTGNIDGDIGGGSKAAIAAYNNSVGSGTTAGKEVSSRVEKVGAKTEYQWLFDHFDSQSKEVPVSVRTQITNTLQNDPENRGMIEALFKHVRDAISQKLPTSQLKKVDGIRNWKEKRDFLNEINSVLMGSKSTNDVAKGLKGVGEYARNLKNTKQGVEAILGKEGLSSDFRSRMMTAVAQAENKISNLTTVNKVSFTGVNVPTITVRSQGLNNQMEAKEKGNMQVITIDGNLGQWDLGEISMADKMVLIREMSYTTEQLGLGKISVSQLQKQVKEGKVNIDFDMVLARNCGNISLMPSVTKKPIKGTTERDGGNRTPDTPKDATTTPETMGGGINALADTPANTTVDSVEPDTTVSETPGGKF